MNFDDKFQKMINNINELFHSPELDKKRKKANQEILNILCAYLLINPTQRFTQALFNLGLDGEFDEESEHTLQIIKSSIGYKNLMEKK